MFDRVAGIIAAAVAERVAQEIAKQMPGVVAEIVDSIGERLPDLSNVDDLIAGIARQVIEEFTKRLPRPFR